MFCAFLDARRGVLLSRRAPRQIPQVQRADEAVAGRLPGVAVRAVLAARRERTTALVYDLDESSPEWARNLRDVGLGLLRKPGDTTAKRGLAITPGASLHTCAPDCQSEAVADARRLWDGANRINYYADGKVPAVGVGHEMFNFNLSGAGAGSGDWLVGVDEVPEYRETAPSRLNPDP